MMEYRKEGKENSKTNGMLFKGLRRWIERDGWKKLESDASENKHNLLYLINLSKAEQESMFLNDPTCYRHMCNPARKTLSFHLL